MTPRTRRIVYVASYELTAIALTLGGLMLLGFGGGHSGTIAVLSSTVAVIWNFTWNTLFEAWEARHPGPRTLRRRLVHSLGFEGGLVVFLVPLIALVLQASLIEAFILEIGLLAFFLIFTFVFSWVFDRIVPPAHLNPASAGASSSAAAPN